MKTTKTYQEVIEWLGECQYHTLMGGGSRYGGPSAAELCEFLFGKTPSFEEIRTAEELVWKRRKGH